MQMAEQTPILPRRLEASLALALTDTPVVCLLGPRQCGKSTLVRLLQPDRSYFDLDEEGFAITARDDPGGFVEALPLRVTLDEVQRVPELMRNIKIAVDRQREPGRFILTGSANLLLLPQTSESLAGRMEILELHPLTEAEKEGREGAFLKTFLDGGFEPKLRPGTGSSPLDLARRLVIGGYPEGLHRSPERMPDWHLQYLKTVIERDVRDIAKIRDGGQLLKLLEILAGQSSGLLNRSAMSRTLQLNRETTDNYLGILEKLFLIRLLPAWHRNRAKRLVKSPKTHFLDAGLAATLMELEAGDWNKRREDFGRILESFVIQQLVAQAGWTDSRLRFWHYRDRDQVEVDCVITRQSSVWGVEVKSSRSASNADTKGLRRLAEQAGKDFQGGIVFYSGESVVKLGEGPFMAMPISKLWTL